MSEPAIVEAYLPGSLGRIAELHGSYYHEQAGFGLFFEARVARELASFLERYDPSCDGFWLVLADGRVEASVAIDGLQAHTEGAHLRWFIVSEHLRGAGFGNALLAKAVAFCRARGYRRVHLDTFEGLHAARHLYQKYGFRLVHQETGTQWGTSVNEQRFELQLPA